MKSVFLDIDEKRIETGEPTIEDLFNFQELNKKLEGKNIIFDSEAIVEMRKAVALHLGITVDQIPKDLSLNKITKAYRNLRDNIYECFLEGGSKNVKAPEKT